MDDYESHQETTAENVGDRTRSAISWQALSKISHYGIQGVSTIILARLLMPEDFGIVSMALIVTGLAVMFRDLGFGQALVQRPKLHTRHIKSAFWITLTIGLFFYGLMYVIAPHLGHYFHDMRMVPVLRLISITFLIGPFNVVPGGLLQRDLEFKGLFFADLAADIAYTVTGISLALTGYGYWSLVWAQLCLVAVRAIALCVIVRYFPPLIPSFNGVKDLIGFGGGVAILSFIYYIRTRIDYLWIGRRLVADDLGNYERAYRMSALPGQLIAGVVNTVLFSALSRIGSDMSRVREVYSRAVTVVALLGLPAAVLMAVSVPELIPAILGSHWREAIAPTQVLCIAGAIMVLFSPTTALAKSMDHVYGLVWRHGVILAILIPAAWFAAGHDIVAVSWVVVAALLLYEILLVQLTKKIIDFGFGSLFQALRGPLAVSLALMGTGELTRLLLLASAWDEPLLVGLATVFIGLAFAITTAIALPFPEMQDAKGELVKLLPCNRG